MLFRFTTTKNTSNVCSSNPWSPLNIHLICLFPFLCLPTSTLEKTVLSWTCISPFLFPQILIKTFNTDYLVSPKMLQAQAKNLALFAGMALYIMTQKHACALDTQCRLLCSLGWETNYFMFNYLILTVTQKGKLLNIVCKVCSFMQIYKCISKDRIIN